MDSDTKAKKSKTPVDYDDARTIQGLEEAERGEAIPLDVARKRMERFVKDSK